jgi:drug/metabolite transporter (DMT)-like permease
VNALLALAASALWGTSDFGGGLISRQLNPSAAVFWSQALALAGLLVLLPFLHVPSGRYMLLAALAGVLATLSLAAFYRAMAAAPMSLVAPITASGTGIPVLAGLLRGEHLGALQLSGIGVTLIGIVLASGPELSSGAPVRRRALALAIAAAIGFGAAYTLLALAARAGGVYGTLLCQRTGGLIVLAPVVLRAGLLTASRLSPRQLAALGAVGGCDIAANGSYALAASRGDLSVAAVLASLYPVVTALLARIILSERLRMVQSIGVIAALGGVLLLST